MGAFCGRRALGRRVGLVASVAEGLPIGVAAAAERHRPAVVGEGVFLSLVIGDPQADAERRDALLVLGLKADASPIAIKAAWRKLSRQHHPDRQLQADDAAKAASAERFDAVQKAWKRLQDDDDA